MSFFRTLSAQFFEERFVFPLWCVVLFGIGICWYFALKEEPVLGVYGVLWGGSVLLYVIKRARLLGICALSFLTGFTISAIKTHSLKHPVLSEPLYNVYVEGIVTKKEQRENSVRFTLKQALIHGTSTKRTKIRLIVRSQLSPEEIAVGSHITARALCFPPPDKVLADGYDFHRDFWFKGLTATAIALSILDISPRVQTLQSRLENLRLRLSHSITKHLKGNTASLAKALILGMKKEVSEETKVAFRRSGLAHILAISGMHIGLLTAVVFFLMRYALSAIPAFSLRFNTKLWAILGGVATAFFYLLLSGASLPTKRAFLLVSVIPLGIALFRPISTLRALGLCAFILLCLSPQSLLSASFQLSFAAVLCLIVGFKQLRGLHQKLAFLGGISSPVVFVLSLFLSTLLAVIPTSLIAWYHFQNVSFISLFCNLLGVPLLTFWIMPCIVLYLGLTPLGLEFLPLWGLSKGLVLLEQLALYGASIPYGWGHFPKPTTWSFCLVIVSGLWFLLWQGRWRFWGVPFLLSGFLFMVFLPNLADIQVLGEAKLVGITDGRGQFFVSRSNTESFARSAWFRVYGQEKEAYWPDGGGGGGAGFFCDGEGCILEKKGYLVGFPKTKRAAMEDCMVADFVIFSGNLPPFCKGLGGERLRAGRAHSVWLKKGIKVKSAEGNRNRPWHRAALLTALSP